VHAAISAAKNELVFPDDFVPLTPRAQVQEVYRRYQELLLANNALDFDDLLLYTAYMLENEPTVRERYARRYEHFWWMSFKTPTRPSTTCSSTWLPSTATSLSWEIPTSPFTAGAGQITATCCALKRPTRMPRSSCWSRTTAPPRQY
jgi:hypothetical protein